ncbi:GNAT family N-acetyltransferase [Thermopirellula anaerolimosa]
MRVLIVHHALSPQSSLDDRDVLHQAEFIRQSLLRLGHVVDTLSTDLDLQRFRDAIRRLAPDVVFHLVESLGGTDRLSYLSAGVLDALAVPYTGCSTQALFQTNDKLLTKNRLRAAGLPTPDWIDPARPVPFAEAGRGERGYLIKSAWEHASAGIEEVVRPASTEELYRDLLNALDRMTAQTRRPWFAEAFIEGREFNLSVLGGTDRPEVLPPAEIDFSAFPPNKPRIVGYKAKWEEDSFEYRATPRRFEFPDSDRPLLRELRRLAVACWDLFELRGYARVDFRVDPAGRPYILEINANPCLSPDAGFMAAAAAGGYGPEDVLARILADAITPPREPALRAPLLAADIGPTSPQDDRTRFRADVTPADVETVRRLVESTGFFHPEETVVAVELVQERLAKGPASGYEFIFAEDSRGPVGYTCYGPIPCTRHSWDLYWIAVAPDRQGRGLGKRLMHATESAVRAAGGTRIYIDTSSREQYAPTRAFYERCGYRTVAVLEDFYAPGDGKVILEKRL